MSVRADLYRRVRAAVRLIQQKGRPEFGMREFVELALTDQLRQVEITHNDGNAITGDDVPLKRGPRLSGGADAG
ncbi:50S ribosomal protein L7ae [Nocardia salmonicida]|uniref:50S ribosomal protein L7ae n=1 Tax=Nocardia salmonicida TaxID=53431 RepID=UPI000AB3AA5E|nr:50S ribosomal protein L7ae [Nocardia salmonicida]